MPHIPPAKRGDTEPLLSLRTALILLLALLTGTGAGMLTWLAAQPPAAAILVGLAASGAAIKFFHWLIADEETPEATPAKRRRPPS